MPQVSLFETWVSFLSCCSGDFTSPLTNDGNHTYFYDAESRVIQVNGTLGNCSTATLCYSYDALGRRVEKTIGSSHFDYIRDVTGKVVADWCVPCGSYNGWNNGYVYLNGGMVAQYQGGTTRFTHPDHLGSTRLQTGLNQAVVQNLDYLPFGEHNSSDSYVGAYDFTGLERDLETTLDHADFRLYSSPLGRWMTPDPAGLAAVDITNPQSWNRYSYVLNNPLALVDPFGLCGGGMNDPGGPCVQFSYTDENGCTVTVTYHKELGWDGYWYDVPDTQTDCSNALDSTGGPGGPPGITIGNTSGVTQQLLTPNGSCTPSVFNPDCKKPSCPAVYVKGIVTDLVGDGIYHAAAEGSAKPAINAAAQDAVARHIVNRGLVVPLRSSIVRRLILTGEIAGELVAAAPIYYSELVAFKDAYKDARAGTCTTIWSKVTN